MLELSSDEQNLQDAAMEFAKQNKQMFIDKFIGNTEPSLTTSVSILMAGSPGAGKTEVSKRLLEIFKTESPRIIRLDTDEIREMLPGYNGSNSHLFQRPAVRALEYVHEECLKKKISFILDGTFSNQEKSFENIRRYLKRDRKIFIIYIYQNPLKAWAFTQAREQKEGRRILKENFIHQFFQARKNVSEAKKHFGNQVILWLVLKDYYRPEQWTQFTDIDTVDSHITEVYTKSELEELI